MEIRHNWLAAVVFGAALCSTGCVAEVDEDPVDEEEEVAEAQDRLDTLGTIDIKIYTPTGSFCELEVSFHESANVGYTSKSYYTTTSSGGVCKFYKGYALGYKATHWIAAGAATYNGQKKLTSKKTGQIPAYTGYISTSWSL
ncbi:hypothetical protein [Polyangium sp. y55x31]|uniref:hypothetical protein n=1 Tax=Polyangium sp. y55x31 TaxID=3042688 RepID=UPI0024825857|nr:hypothetical protein [Polyangium sp. y55x31]MDI1483614.1 hypothetical protein [Polyangium sp. y55x31]